MNRQTPLFRKREVVKQILFEAFLQARKCVSEVEWLKKKLLSMKRQKALQVKINLP